jgi:hypothetical protein
MDGMDENLSRIVPMKSVGLFGLFVVVLALMSVAEAEVQVSVIDTSSRVVSPGEAVQVQIRLYNAVPTPLDGELAMALVDFQGRTAATVSKPVSVLAGDDRLVTLQPTAPGPGYFSVDVRVKAGETVLFDRHTVWSIAVLDRGADPPGDSPFGTYLIGNTVMLADIVPKGFYENMARMGARWGTLDTWWSRIEVAEGTCDWAYYEQWFQAARAAGITPIPHLFGMPKWISSQPDRDDYWAYPPRDWTVWERFVGDFVRRNQDWLVYLRVWNEPNCGYWKGTRADYAQLVIHASQAAKRVKPDIKIIIEAAANPALDVIPFFDEVDAAGATPYWDVLAIHNYWLNNRDFPEHTNFLKIYRDVIAWEKAHKPGAEVWDSEFACMADDWGTEWVGVGETKQAQWLARAHVLGFSLGLNKMFWFPGYSWPDPTTPPYYNPAGLLRPDLSPRPAYVAYHTLASALSGAHYDASLSAGTDRYGVVFKTPGGFVTALWSVDAAHIGSVTLNVGKGAQVTRTTLMGEHDVVTGATDSGQVIIPVDENMVLVATSVLPTVDSGAAQ